jgi:hypothetical protein
VKLDPGRHLLPHAVCEIINTDYLTILKKQKPLSEIAADEARDTGD